MTTEQSILQGLGYNPGTHSLRQKTHPQLGVVVHDDKGRPVHFYSHRVLKDLGKDEMFLQAYGEGVGL